MSDDGPKSTRDSGAPTETASVGAGREVVLRGASRLTLAMTSAMSALGGCSMRWVLMVIAFAVISDAAASQAQPGCCACLQALGDSTMAASGSGPALFCAAVPDGADTTPLADRCDALGGSEFGCFAVVAPFTDGSTAGGTPNCSGLFSSEGIICPAVGAPALQAPWSAALIVLLAALASVRLARRRPAP